MVSCSCIVILSNMVFKIDIKGLNPDTPPPPSKSSTLVEEVRKLAQRHGLSWVTRAVGEIGVKEEPNRCCKRISEYADAIPDEGPRTHMKSGNQAWCACFVYWRLSDVSGPKPSGWDIVRAKEYMSCFEKSGILFGSIAVKKGGKNYHVTIVVGVSPDRKIIYGLGGNQNDEVNITGYEASQILGYRFPVGYPQIPPITVQNQGGIPSGGSTR